MTLTVQELKLGADPEVFIYDMANKTYVSAHDIVPGSKEEPFTTNYGAIQVDGVAAEFNILPASELKPWMRSIKQGLNHIISLAKRKNPNYTVMISPVATFKQDYFNQLPEDVIQLGCNPDFSAYTRSANDTPHTDEPFRTGAGHVHIGWYPKGSFVEDYYGDEKHFSDCISLVKDLDASIYLLSHLWDHDTKRRTLYGARGAFRPKPYGMEYRSISNAWLGDPLLRAWIFNAVSHVVLLHDSGFVLSEIQELADLGAVFVKNNKNILSKDGALKAHEFLVKTLEFPPLPSIYLG